MTVSKVEDATQKIEHLSLVAKRPARAVSGKPVEVLSNSFPVNITLEHIHVYSVKFEPDIPEDSTDLRRREINERSIREKLEKTHGIYFFENTRLWSLRHVPGEQSISNASLKRTVSITFVKSVDLTNVGLAELTQHQQIAHIILNKAIQASQLTRIGANFFEKKEPLFGGSTGLDIKGERGSPNIRLWRGYSMTMEYSVEGLQMHCDVVHRVLHQQNVCELIESLFKAEMKNGKSREESDSFVKKKVERMLTDCAVITLYNKRVYRINAIDWSLGLDNTFSKDNKEISFRDYFKQAYGEVCKQKFRGMLVHIPKRRKNAPEKIILAPELCHMTGLTKTMKSNYTFMRKIADKTRIPASERHQMGANLVSRLQESIRFENGEHSNIQKGKGVASSRVIHPETITEITENTEIIYTNNKKKQSTQTQKLPLKISEKAVMTTGHILPKFSIHLADSRQKISKYNPYQQFQSAYNNASFVNKAIVPVKNWAILAETDSIARNALRQIVKVCDAVGLIPSFLNDSPIVWRVKGGNFPKHDRPDNPHGRVWEEAIRDCVSEHNPQIILCVLPDSKFGSPTAVYNRIKTYCCTVNPVLTQCVQTKSVNNFKRVAQIMKNVAKQMLTKAGNIPWSVDFSLPTNKFDFKSIPTMVCGMDVNHDMKRNVSTVSFCASYSHDFSSYFTFVHHQASGREVMIDGANLIIQALKKFKSKHKFLPRQIIIYRDGVSTSQLSKIVLHEVRAYKKAFQTIKIGGRDYDPKLSVIVTQKNVSARFLTSDYKTLAPGTLIDSSVVSAHFWDFYVVPCEAPFKGTASPTRFIVVYDDHEFDQGDIAAFTNQLCMLFYNWAGPVRVPAPVQYAHKIAHMFGTAIDQRKPADKLNGRPFYL